jgi:hypothetical protein
MTGPRAKAPPIAPASRPATVLQGGRHKAYRPLGLDERIAAIEAGLDAYRRGDFFEAHELLEPAWMGTDRMAEREFVQALIKLAAAYVHAVRGNPAGIEKNLRGARARLAASLEAAPTDPSADPSRDLPAPLSTLDRAELLARIDDRISGLADGAPPAAPPMLTSLGAVR